MVEWLIIGAAALFAAKKKAAPTEGGGPVTPGRSTDAAAARPGGADRLDRIAARGSTETARDGIRRAPVPAPIVLPNFTDRDQEAGDLTAADVAPFAVIAGAGAGAIAGGPSGAGTGAKVGAMVTPVITAVTNVFAGNAAGLSPQEEAFALSGTSQNRAGVTWEQVSTSSTPETSVIRRLAAVEGRDASKQLRTADGDYVRVGGNSGRLTGRIDQTDGIGDPDMSPMQPVDLEPPPAPSPAPALTSPRQAGASGSTVAAGAAQLAPGLPVYDSPPFNKVGVVPLGRPASSTMDQGVPSNSPAVLDMAPVPLPVPAPQPAPQAPVGISNRAIVPAFLRRRLSDGDDVAWSDS